MTSAGRSVLISEVNARSCDDDSKLRANRMTPPTSGWTSRARSAGQSVNPSTPSMTGPCAELPAASFMLHQEGGRCASDGANAGGERHREWIERGVPRADSRRPRGLPHQRLHFAHRLAQPDEDTPRNDRMADVQ